MDDLELQEKLLRKRNEDLDAFRDMTLASLSSLDKEQAENEMPKPPMPTSKNRQAFPEQNVPTGLQTEVRLQRCRIAALQKELELAKEHVNVASADERKLREENKKLKGESRKGSSEVSDLQKQLEKQTKIASELQMKLLDANSTLASLRIEHEALAARLKKAEADCLASEKKTEKLLERSKTVSRETGATAAPEKSLALLVLILSVCLC
eukprot:TRINITY_DN41362_c0_g1_i1.p1 TRINITY_DN41362_c0_g1~~TRINITY_DN41362_c0_g1_i1.p1  ORF type:complete len:210 (-),score=43.21 TRINITY_DN41362_c0_g1_i1:330-959(-)